MKRLILSLIAIVAVAFSSMAQEFWGQVGPFKVGEVKEIGVPLEGEYSYYFDAIEYEGYYSCSSYEYANYRPAPNGKDRIVDVVPLAVKWVSKDSYSFTKCQQTLLTFITSNGIVKGESYERIWPDGAWEICYKCGRYRYIFNVMRAANNKYAMSIHVSTTYKK